MSEPIVLAFLQVKIKKTPELIIPEFLQVKIKKSAGTISSSVLI
jgi:hypothetical protein